MKDQPNMYDLQITDFVCKTSLIKSNQSIKMTIKRRPNNKNTCSIEELLWMWQCIKGEHIKIHTRLHLLTRTYDRSLRIDSVKHK